MLIFYNIILTVLYIEGFHEDNINQYMSIFIYYNRVSYSSEHRWGRSLKLIAYVRS